jgi:hypothetical protein
LNVVMQQWVTRMVDLHQARAEPNEHEACFEPEEGEVVEASAAKRSPFECIRVSRSRSIFDPMMPSRDSDGDDAKACVLTWCGHVPLDWPAMVFDILVREGEVTHELSGSARKQQMVLLVKAHLL